MVSVTKLLKILNKEALLKWANRIGLEGLSLEEHNKKSKGKGNDLHEKIENYLKNGVDFEYSQELTKLLLGFEIIGIEMDLDNGFICGRTDLRLEKNGLKYVVDFKSSGKIYIDQKIQLSTYKEILNFDRIAIINFKTWEFTEIQIDTKKYYDILKCLYKIHQLTTELNERI